MWDNEGEDDAHRAWVSGVPISADVKNEGGGDPMSRVRAVGGGTVILVVL